jgi:hypothetical protein
MRDAVRLLLPTASGITSKKPLYLNGEWSIRWWIPPTVGLRAQFEACKGLDRPICPELISSLPMPSWRRNDAGGSPRGAPRRFSRSRGLLRGMPSSSGSDTGEVMSNLSLRFAFRPLQVERGLIGCESTLGRQLNVRTSQGIAPTGQATSQFSFEVYAMPSAFCHRHEALVTKRQKDKIEHLRFRR